MVIQGSSARRFPLFARAAAVVVAIVLAVPAAPSAVAGPYQLDLHLHSGEVDPPEFAADAALLPVVAAAKTTRPAGSDFDFIGVTAGAPMWLLPRSQNPSVLYLSVGTEELPSGDFAGPLTWTLTSVSGSGGGAAPGVFSVWNSLGGITPLMSSAGGTPNSFSVSAGGHTHFNYGFTAPGLYDVAFSVSAPLAASLGGGTATGSAVYSFGVFDAGSDYEYPAATPWTYQGRSFSVALVGNEHIDMGVALVAVPEPSAAVLCGLGAVGLGWVGLRRRIRCRGAARMTADRRR